MENGTDSSSNILIPVTEYSDEFKRKILAPLQSAFLYEESKVSFRFKSASLVKNPVLTQKYVAFRAKRRQAGYSEDDLEETYGFLLFDDVNKANALGQTGVLTGSSSCSSLGDPLKGVYVSMFSDCLSPERWQDGQSGYIVIIKLTTGRVRRVSENHTKDICAPTVGFDCHVSQDLASVTTQTSFSLAFERSQCYIYELLDNGSNKTAQSPSLTCPFAIVAFSYKKRRTLAIKEPKPCGFISCEILRILPVLHLPEGEVKKTKLEQNKELHKVLADPMQTYTVLLNQDEAPVTTLAPTVNDTNSSLSSSSKPVSPLHTGAKDQIIVEKTPAKLETSTIKAITGGSVATINRQKLKRNDELPNNNNDLGVKKSQTPDIPAELVLNSTCGKNRAEKSPVSPTKLETSVGEVCSEATSAPNNLQVLNKTDDQRVQNFQINDPAELMVDFNSKQNSVSPAKLGTVSGEDGAMVAPNDLPVPKGLDDLTVKTVQITDVPAELIFSFTSEQSVAAESRVNPVPPKKSLPAKRNRVFEYSKIASLTRKQQRKYLEWKYSRNKIDSTETCFETPGIEKIDQSSQADQLSNQAEQKTATSNLDWDKLKSLIINGRKVKPVSAESVVMRNPGKRTLLSPVAMDLEGLVREKSERWNLNPVLSECGRVLVPYGSRDKAHLAKSFLEKANVKQLSSHTKAPNALRMEHHKRSASPELEKHENDIIKSQAANAAQTTLQETEDGQNLVQAGVHELTQPISDQCPTKHEPRCVLSSRKTRKYHFDLHENPEDVIAETEPCLKKNRVDADVKSSTSSADTAVELEESTLQAVKHGEMPNMLKQSGVEYTYIRKALLETQVKKAQILCRPPSIYPKWKRIKTLRKHVDISREHFKKTWWMHLKSSHTSETVKDCTRNYSVRKKTAALNPSTDALTLLADLALGGNNELVSSQPDRKVESQPQSGLRKSDCSKDVTCDAKVSVLHALLGQPVTRPSPNALIEGDELVRLLCKEHAYSLPQYTLIPSGLPGTPFQVSPLSGSTGLRYRHHTTFGLQTPHASDNLEDENKICGPSDHSRKWMYLFNHNRSFVCNHGSVQVTRQWKEKYDFDRDSRFASDSKDRTIIRALHGPWDFSVQDTMEDMQLIVHMWIGFFYSRSTARSIDFGSNLATQHSDEGSAAEITSRAQYQLEVDRFSLPQGLENTTELYFSDVSDLSNNSLDQGSDVLNWSFGNSDTFKVLHPDPLDNSIKASNSQRRLKEKPTTQSYQTMILSADTLKKSSNEHHLSLSQEDGYLQHKDLPSLKEDLTHKQVEMEMISVGTENRGMVVGMDSLLDKSNHEEFDLKGGSDATKLKLLKDSDLSLKERELHKDAGEASSSVPQMEHKNSNTFCNRNLSKSETSEAEEAKDSTFAKDCCKRSNNQFVKAADEDSCISVFTAENGRDLSDYPLTIVFESDDSETEVQSIEPNDKEKKKEKQQSPTGIELQPRVLCQNQMRAHDVSGYTFETSSEVGIGNNASSSESISSVNCKMTNFTSQKTYSLETESSYNPTSPFHFRIGAGKDEKRATVAPKHSLPKLIQFKNVKHFGSHSEFVKNAQNKLQDIHCEVIHPLNGLSGKNSPPTDHQSHVVDVANNTSMGYPKNIPELSSQKLSALKVSETRHPDIVGDTDETINGIIHERAYNQQNNLSQCGPVQLEINLESIKERQDKKVEEIPCGVVSPLKVQNPSPTGCQSSVEGTVRKQAEAEFAIATNSFKSVGELLLCRESVLQVADASQADATVSVGGGVMGFTVAQTHQQSILIESKTLKQLESDVECEGRDQNIEEIRCAVIFPLGGFSEENSSLTGSQNSFDEIVRKKTETEFDKRSGSPKSIIKRSPRRVSVLKVSETSQMNIAEGWLDYESTSHKENDKPKRVPSEPRINCSDIPDSRIDTKSSLASQIETTNVKVTLGQHSNDTKDRNAKPSQAASTSQCLRPEPLDCLVDTLLLKHKPGEYRCDVPTCSKESLTTKCRFYMLVTSEDSFFEETKACLEEAGHTAVQPAQFLLSKECSSMLIVVRNEDISTHLFEIPHLLELKMSPNVRFAGIDEPQDLMNFTHQELFLSGGFVMLDQQSLESLSLDKVKRFLEVLQDLNKSEKWKWLLHYRDSRRFKENARLSAEEEEKKNLLTWSQETGLSAVLPYHECDAKSKDQPDYLCCLVHLQVQNIAARFPVFLTDTRTSGKFEKNGILTTTVNSFLKRFST
ncbi:uncharacterized protein tasor2 [Corythoichthys intestinalis]|uniref:uncharacterized protein tasor2 n=1 Tax=Corythoichthys intestinalis TaxID=161448 RepID=UPI0025A5CAE2|nr:uncharacterized protein tasor2 [Corythoichthys intestinalis]